MARSASKQPTDVELKILHVLWKEGACSVKRVHELLGKSTAYTTVLKMLRIMADKGLVRRNEDHRAHIYEATSTEQETQQHFLLGLLDRLFHGSSKLLILRALSTKPATPGELAEIRHMIQTEENKKKDKEL